eukprot:394198-Hanusia_phi.AAC.2
MKVLLRRSLRSLNPLNHAQDGFKRRVELVRAIMTYSPDKMFGSKDKSLMYKEVTDSLNQDNVLFGGNLTLTTTRDKWLEVMKVVDCIIAGGLQQMNWTKYISSWPRPDLHGSI